MEIGLAVGGAFLSSALNVIGDRLAPQGEWLKIFQTRKHDPFGLLKQLRRTLLGLQAVLDDAERKQSSNRSVNEWLNELQDAVEDAENLLDEINYAALKLKVEAQHQHSGETSQPQQVSDQFLDEIMPRVEGAIETLEQLEKQIGRLGLLGNPSSRKLETPKRLPTTSVVDDSDVYGRKDEIERLVNHLLLPADEDGEKPSVIPIVGLGGLGKTTLAKVVYNDPRVQRNFDLKAWVCVSEQYDAFKITKALLGESSTAKDNLDKIQIKLKERIKGKKFLFVLDDIWNENYVDWVDLKSLFVQGELGSMVIVTTRKDSVALMMGSDKPIYLKTLLSDESWSLFERHAFKNKALREHPDFQEVGKNIAEKCGGLPLALKAIAGLLRPKSGIKEWRSVLRSDVWEQSVNSGILPALQLSYNDLPKHLKRCFAYLAIFPKDFSFEREYIVQLWIANALVQQPQTDETIEAKGNQYFLELVSRSLLEKELEKFIMHDLVNDLALLVSSKLCLRLEDVQGFHCSTHLVQRARHLSYTMDENVTFKEFEVIRKMERLRTLLSIDPRKSYRDPNKRVLQNILPKLASLRALSLSHCKAMKLPDTVFNELNQLKFLDLSFTDLMTLPDSICKLYNLQTLLLSHCRLLNILPSNFENLISLRYLDIRGTHNRNIQASKWKFVNVLLGAMVIIDEYDGTRIEELGNLHNLHGSLSISELQNVSDMKDAEKAKLREKEHIKELALHWSPVDADNSKNERDILNKLCPSTKIRELKIDGYRGTKFPNWLGDESFCKLSKLSLQNCNNCDLLPSLGRLPFLKSLSIKGMHGISVVTEEFYGRDHLTFQSLVELEFADMPEWKEWDILGNGEFPKLECLSICSCPELVLNFPEKLCSLRKLSIESVRDCRNLSSFLIQNELEEFKIEKCKNFDVAVVPLSLHELEIYECESLMSFARGGSLAPKLKRLHLVHCPKLKSLPEDMRYLLPSLEELWIYDCPEIGYFSEGGLPFSLENLCISDCEKLVNVRKEWRLKELRSLRYLRICHNGSDKGIIADEGWELPSTIQLLHLSNVRSLKGNALESLTSLQTLYIKEIPEIESLLGEGILLSLTSLNLSILETVSNSNLFQKKGSPPPSLS